MRNHCESLRSLSNLARRTMLVQEYISHLLELYRIESRCIVCHLAICTSRSVKLNDARVQRPLKRAESLNSRLIMMKSEAECLRVAKRQGGAQAVSLGLVTKRHHASAQNSEVPNPFIKAQCGV
jgi:hypothetical protein